MALHLPSLEAAPHHIAIIMDGNRRWARERGLPAAAGHKRGVDALRAAVRAAIDHNVRILTVYGFSTENWRREQSEVSSLMQLCASAARSEMFGLVREHVRVRIVGDISPFPPATRAALGELVRATARNDRVTLQLALNYSGRAEIVNAARAIASDVAAGALRAQDVTEETLRERMYAPEVPDPDLLIRTGGDMRVSNFLLYQLAYTEIFTTNVLWPDFNEEQFALACADYVRRQRRFGA